MPHDELHELETRLDAAGRAAIARAQADAPAAFMTAVARKRRMRVFARAAVGGLALAAVVALVVGVWPLLSPPTPAGPSAAPIVKNTSNGGSVAPPSHTVAAGAVAGNPMSLVELNRAAARLGELPMAFSSGVVDEPARAGDRELPVVAGGTGSGGARRR